MMRFGLAHLSPFHFFRARGNARLARIHDRCTQSFMHARRCVIACAMLLSTRATPATARRHADSRRSHAVSTAAVARIQDVMAWLSMPSPLHISRQHTACPS